jgi:hypothetical protein
MLKLHERVVEDLQALKGVWPSVARASGVPMRTLVNVASQLSRYPHVDTLKKLERGMAEVRRFAEKVAQTKLREAKAARGDEGAAA